MNTDSITAITSIPEYNRVIDAIAQTTGKERKRLRALAKAWMDSQYKAGYRHATWSQKDFTR